MAPLTTIVGDFPDSGISESLIAHVFTYDVCSPATYIAAENVDRDWPDAVCCPVLDLDSRLLWRVRDGVEALAAEAGLPLVWPDVPPDGRRAARVAIHARDLGRGLPFALAAARLAFGGGFDLDDDAVLAQAAWAAGLDETAALAAAEDPRYDLELTATARRASELGLALPALEDPVARVASTASRADRKHASIETPRR
jgi:hypothetical protein